MAELNYPAELVGNLQKVIDLKASLKQKLVDNGVTVPDGATVEEMIALIEAGGGESEVYIINVNDPNDHDGDFDTAVSYFQQGKPVIALYVGYSYVAYTYDATYKILYFSRQVDKTDSNTSLICLSWQGTTVSPNNRFLLPQWPKDTVTAADVVKGKTFYKGSNGALLTGTHECPEASGGIDGVSFTATSTSEHDCVFDTAIAAFDAGKPVIIYYGSAATVYNAFRVDTDGTMWFAEQLNAINNKIPLLKLGTDSTLTSTTGRYIAPGTSITATQADVVAGKTALGADGIKFTGTLEPYKLAQGSLATDTSETKTVTKGSTIRAVILEGTASGSTYHAGVYTSGKTMKMFASGTATATKKANVSFSGNTATFTTYETDLFSNLKYYIFYVD